MVKALSVSLLTIVSVPQNLGAQVLLFYNPPRAQNLRNRLDGVDCLCPGTSRKYEEVGPKSAGEGEHP